MNYGLRTPAQNEELPKSKSPAAVAQLVAKRVPAPLLVPQKDGYFAISGGWELQSERKLKIELERVRELPPLLSLPGYDTQSWYNAVVPGTVLTTLVRSGVYPDPYYGLNNLQIPDDLCRQPWWYRSTFRLPQESVGKQILLRLNGVNYIGEIFLNGKSIGRVQGAFMRGEFDVTDKAFAGEENVIAIRIEPPFHPGIPHEQTLKSGIGPNGGALCLDGPTFICSEGWDWIPGVRDRNIGLWQDVCVKWLPHVQLSDPHVVTSLPLPDLSKASVALFVQAINRSEVAQKVKIKAQIESVTVEREVSLAPHATEEVQFNPKDYSALNFKNPRLWWPVGYGKPELYSVTFTAETANRSLEDQISTRFGIRQFTYEIGVRATNGEDLRVEYDPVRHIQEGKQVLDTNKRILSQGCEIESFLPSAQMKQFNLIPDEKMKNFMVFRINGKRLYLKGGNWGMDDMMKQVSRARLEPYIRLHREANINIIRNWTGSSMEEDLFDLCDEYGILVWNDFWLSTKNYNLEPYDEGLFLRNVRDTVRRFRNHASIAYWCGRNEGSPPDSLNAGIAQIIAEEDGTRHYQSSSIKVNLRGSGPWDYLPDPKKYYSPEGPTTELGTPSLPTAETILSMMPKIDTWPISDTWAYHDWHKGQKGFCEEIENNYGKAKDLEDFCRKGQMVNYESHRAIWEGWQSHLFGPNSMAFIWMTHPSWPSMVWQIYTSDMETHAPFWATKNACEPIHIQMGYGENQDRIQIVNTGIKDLQKGQATLDVFDCNSKPLMHEEYTVDVKANSQVEAFKINWQSNLPDFRLIRLRVLDAEKKVSSENWYWKYYGSNPTKKMEGLNQMKAVSLSLKNSGENQLSGDQVTSEIEIVNSSNTIALMIKLNLRNKSTGKRILPAYFSDNYFSLLPGEKKSVSVDWKSSEKSITTISTEGWNIPRKEYPMK